MLGMRTEGKKRSASTAGRLGAVPPPKKGLKLAGFRLRPDQLAALRKEALRRAGERESRQPDASELVREAVDAWLAKHARKQ
jgi:hypothetical protein